MLLVRRWRASETQIQAAWLMDDSTMPLMATRTQVNMATMTTSKSIPPLSCGTTCLSNLPKMMPRTMAPVMQTATSLYSSFHHL
ncbi:hypothetical protein CH063_12871 [Colletotrichum higginsianum]|uniref:Uncharacterized protein n=1 Tax=Colletotrichum higginsianum (strain IMI 349063) TaxID=759273 RepID=H1VS53_COLHI|nr:hypothetical protein CH063_12871 [Colletotrichum higginsianum]